MSSHFLANEYSSIGDHGYVSVAGNSNVMPGIGGPFINVRWAVIFLAQRTEGSAELLISTMPLTKAGIITDKPIGK